MNSNNPFLGSKCENKRWITTELIWLVREREDSVLLKYPCWVTLICANEMIFKLFSVDLKIALSLLFHINSDINLIKWAICFLAFLTAMYILCMGTTGRYAGMRQNILKNSEKVDNQILLEFRETKDHTKSMVWIWDFPHSQEKKVLCRKIQGGFLLCGITPQNENEMGSGSHI